MAITEKLSSNNAVNALAVAVSNLPGGKAALEAAIAEQIAEIPVVAVEMASLDEVLATEVVESTPAEEIPATEEILPDGNIALE